MSKLIIIFALFFAVCTVTILADSDHYWRDYNGTIPSDAFIDIDTNLVISQISTVKKCGGLIPAGLNRFTRVAETECSGRFGRSHHIKVLCTRNPDRYYWQWNNVTSLITHDDLVVGGYEDWIGELLYIGKVFKHGAWHIGKVFTNKMRVGLFFNPVDGQQFTEKYCMVLKYR